MAHSDSDNRVSKQSKPSPPTSTSSSTSSSYHNISNTPVTHNMDWISHLPQSILHDILSRLPEEDAARTSLLSKAWHDTWSTFPLLVFNESRFEMAEVPDGADMQLRKAMFLLNRYKFCNWVGNILLSFQCKQLPINKFKLVFKSLPPPDLLPTVNHWIKFVCDSGVEELELRVSDYVQQIETGVKLAYHEFAWLPLCVLEANSLIKLELSWYFRVDRTFLNSPIKFASLQVLSLSHIYFGDGQMIHYLIYSCPLIENLELNRCYGVKSVSIRGLPKLKKVYIVGVEEVDVDAPGLEDLCFSGFQTFICCKINMDRCRNLRELSLSDVNSIIITDQWLVELFQKFPLLDTLVLEGFSMSDFIHISSNQLKVLKLCNCQDLDEIEIVAPNLFKCTYHCDGSIIPSISILDCSIQFVLEVVFFVDFLLDLDYLRTFLQVIPKHIPVSLFLGFGDDSTVEFDPFLLERCHRASPSIKHLTLCAVSDAKEWCLLLVSRVFWSCRPSVVSFNLGVNKTLVKIFCEKLMGRKENDCCSYSEAKCWWHFLEGVKVSSSFMEHNVDDDIKTLLEAFPILSSEEEEEISLFKVGHIKFMLEWQSNCKSNTR
ncbi:hypothetical protein RIF29_28958 [Crotalaria pallida]|uniref:F-box domain-containing protein n=1 Tax=Crotalaria pallida TaxID=3830 RepID=A0AAN9EFT8_CROPI